MFEDNEPTSLSLLEGLKNHDEDSWVRFVAIAGPVVYARCRRHGLSEADAADVTQETFLKVRKAIDRFTKDRPDGRFRAWFSVVVKNAIRDHGRVLAKTQRGSGDSAVQGFLNNVADEIDEDTSFSPVDSDHVLLMRQALKVIEADFKPAVWKAFWMCHIDELSAPEVAEKLEMKPGAVRQAVFRVRKRLKEQTEGLFD